MKRSIFPYHTQPHRVSSVFTLSLVLTKYPFGLVRIDNPTILHIDASTKKTLNALRRHFSAQFATM